MSVGLLRLTRDESFDPLSDVGDVVWFLQTLRMSLPRFGKLTVYPFHINGLPLHHERFHQPEQ